MTTRNKALAAEDKAKEENVALLEVHSAEARKELAAKEKRLEETTFESQSVNQMLSTTKKEVLVKGKALEDKIDECFNVTGTRAACNKERASYKR